jgi:hypothetical protein
MSRKASLRSKLDESEKKEKEVELQDKLVLK